MIKRIVAVSTASVENNQELLDYIQEIEFAGADRLHCDVMDGIIVRQASFDESGLAIILSTTKLPVDVHLMVYQPHKQLKKYLKIKPDSITLQYEHFSTEKQLRKNLIKIQKAGIKTGLALSPEIPVSYILPFVPYIDELLIMGTSPNDRESKMYDGAIDKIKNAVDLKNRFKKDLIISFKGGVTFENVNKLYDSGVNIVIADDLVYKCFSRKYAIENLKNPTSHLIDTKRL